MCLEEYDTIWRQNNRVGYRKLVTIDCCCSDFFPLFKQVFYPPTRFAVLHFGSGWSVNRDAYGVNNPRLKTKAVEIQHGCACGEKNPTQVHKDVAGFSELRN